MADPGPEGNVVIQTDRLVLRQMVESDADFIRGLLNEPSFLRFVGDKGVRTKDQAVEYIRTGPMASYASHGFGLYLVSLREGGVPIGICGLVVRDWLEHPDLGFSLLPAYWSRGYAREAAATVLARARETHGLAQVLAFTNPDNRDSIQLLERLGFAFSSFITVKDEVLSLFALRLSTT